MSRLIAQIMLSILVYPLAGLVYLIAFFVWMETQRGPDREQVAFAVGGVLTWAFVAVYWTLLWRKSIAWTPERTWRTILCYGGALLVAGAIGAVLGGMTGEEEFGFFIATAAAPLLWQVGTIVVWRETDAERATRLAKQGVGQLLCPTCGYNLTGLKGTRCPECGSEFTLDAILAGQAANRQAEVES